MAKIIVFKDHSFKGDALVCRGTEPNLKPQGWNDCISSLIVIDGSWALFKDVDYAGKRWEVSATGGPEHDGVYPDYADWQGENDAISSLKPD